MAAAMKTIKILKDGASWRERFATGLGDTIQHVFKANDVRTLPGPDAQQLIDAGLAEEVPLPGEDFPEPIDVKTQEQKNAEALGGAFVTSDLAKPFVNAQAAQQALAGKPVPDAPNVYKTADDVAGTKADINAGTNVDAPTRPSTPSSSATPSAAKPTLSGPAKPVEPTK